MKTKQLKQPSKPLEEYAWLYDQDIYDDAVTSGIIEDYFGTILTDWKEKPHLDIDTIAKKPVRFLLCVAGFREWRDTMLWRRLYEEGTTFVSADHITLSEMTDETIYDIFFHYCAENDKFADTIWGHYFHTELRLRDYA
jgi:hypothetical protein